MIKMKESKTKQTKKELKEGSKHEENLYNLVIWLIYTMNNDFDGVRDNINLKIQKTFNFIENESNKKEIEFLKGIKND